MAVAELETLPDNSRLWVFEADRAFEPGEVEQIESATRDFLRGWVAHGSDLTAACEVAHNRFLLIAVDEDATAASGCSIDRLTRFITDLGGTLGASLLDRNSVTYRDGEEIVRVTRPAFKELVAAEKVSESTLVFDNTVTQLSAVRGDGWETPASRSWHVSFFRR